MKWRTANRFLNVGVVFEGKNPSEMSVAMCYLSSTAVAQPWEWADDCAKNNQDFDDDNDYGNLVGEVTQ